MTSGGLVAGRHIDVFGYRVHVAPWLLDAVGRVTREVAPAHTIAVITDDEVADFHGAHLVGSLRHFGGAQRIIYRAIPSGERHKTREQWSALTDWMIDERCGRDTTIVALGGGVVGDLAGFVAATYMRGIPFVQVPTSLLAMVDASVGGKVGVDTAAGKNLVGAFHQPRAVLVDPTLLQTLSLPHLRAGMAEVIKHGVIADPEYLVQAQLFGAQLLAARAAMSGERSSVNAAFEGVAPLEWHGEALASLVARSIEIKAEVVRQDEREGGIRQILNFGHTIGHAVEVASGFSLLHGEAISIGMTLEAELAERVGVAAPGTRDTVRHALCGLGLPTALPGAYTAPVILEAMRGDKKSRSGRLVFALPESIGRMAGSASGFGTVVDETDILAVLWDGAAKR